MYPLVGCRLYDNWTFECTEIDRQSVRLAQQNVDRNQLTERIKIHWNSDPSTIFSNVPCLSNTNSQDICFDFTMCNPPFYSSRQELQECTQSKSQPAYSQLRATDQELVTEGGEREFARRMVGESRRLRHKVKWCTCLFGRKSNADSIERELRSDESDILVKSTPLVQGKTRRWVLAWSWNNVLD